LNWADSAILAAATLAAVNVIDSHLISKRLPSLGAFLLPVGVIALVWGLVVLFVSSWPEDVGASPILTAVASGTIRGIGILAFLYVMRTEEVSRVIPVVNIHPVFVAIMAVPLLDETLTFLEWIAIFITVIGAVLISTKSNGGRSRPWRLSKIVVLPFVAALCLATANLTSKYAMDDISFWNMYAIGSISLACVTLAVSARPAVISALGGLERPKSTMALLGFNEMLAPIGALLLFWSIERGPVSLVSAIAGAQPVFVFVYAVVLSRMSSGVLLEQRMSKQTLAMRLLAIAMIVGGITIIHLV
jgi:drug/metabolite transporter (DMT)-like permease